MFGSGKKLSDKTVALYTHNLTKLNQGKPITDNKFLGKFKKIMEEIKAKPKTTGRSYLIAIVSYLKDKDEKLYNKYYNEMMNFNKELKNNTEKSDKQKENWISQEDIMKIQEDMMQYLPKKTKKTLSPAEYDKLLDLVVLSLYTLQPPRRCIDYVDMLVEKSEDTKHNYLDGDKFIFNNYKTKGTYKQQIEQMNPKLYEIIKVYLKYKPVESNFLIDERGKPFNHSNQITRRLNKIFNKKISVSMMRNIYLTDKYSLMNSEKLIDANAMGTSITTIDMNYVKAYEPKSHEPT